MFEPLHIPFNRVERYKYYDYAGENWTRFDLFGYFVLLQKLLTTEWSMLIEIV